MKRFHFPLGRVLAWRVTQAQIAQAELDRLRAELAQVDTQSAALEARVREEDDRVRTSESTTALELTALENYRHSAASQRQQIEYTRRAVTKKIEEQTVRVVERRRAAKLLEKLRQKQFETWQTGSAREIEQGAADAFLARWQPACNEENNEAAGRSGTLE